MASKDNTAIFLLFTKDMTDDDIIKIFKQFAKQVPDMLDNNIIFMATTSCWDGDTRELHNIPEAKKLFKKIVDLGWYGLTSLPKMYGKNVLPDVDMPKDEINIMMQQFVVPAIVAYGQDNTIDKKLMQKVLAQSMIAFNTLMEHEMMFT